MKTTLQVGRIAGVPIQFHWTFVLVLLWVGASSWQPGYGINTAVLAWLSSWVSLVFLAVLLHELGHALMAKRLSIHTSRIVLYPLGGGAFLDRQPTRPRDEWLISMAGPLVNIVLTALLAPLVFGHPSRGDLLWLMIRPESNLVVFDTEWYDYGIVVFFALNLVLAAFNLLPAYPLDGGRMLRAVLSRRLDRHRASMISAWMGIGFALIFLLLAAWIGDVFFALGALFIGLLAGAEIALQRRRRHLSTTVVREHLAARWLRLHVHAGDTLADVREQLPSTTEGEQLVLILDEWQQPYAVSDLAGIQDPNLDEREKEAFFDLLGPRNWQGLHPRENLIRLAELLEDGNPHCGFPVIDDHGRLVGLLSRQKAIRLMKRRR